MTGRFVFFAFVLTVAVCLVTIQREKALNHDRCLFNPYDAHAQLRSCCRFQNATTLLLTMRNQTLREFNSMMSTIREISKRCSCEVGPTIRTAEDFWNRDLHGLTPKSARRRLDTFVIANLLLDW